MTETEAIFSQKKTQTKNYHAEYVFVATPQGDPISDGSVRGLCLTYVRSFFPACVSNGGHNRDASRA